MSKWILKMPSQGSVGVAAAPCNAVLANVGDCGDGLREEGMVKSFNKIKGYGFIRIQSRTDDVYFKTEDLTPRSKQFAEEAPRINGAPVTCAPEAFGDSRVRARAIRLGERGSGVKQPSTRCAPAAAEADVIKCVVAEPAVVAPSKISAVPAQPRSWGTKKAPSVPIRPRGWGQPSAEELKSQKEQLKAMGFSEEQAADAMASGLDFNQVLDTLLSGGTLPTKRLSSDELESFPSTREGSDDASEDRSSSCGTGDKSPESVSKSPDGNCEEPVEDLKNSSDVEANLEELLGACDSDKSDGEVPAAVLPVIEAAEVVLPVSSQKTATTARQFARVISNYPDENSAAGQLSLRQGTVVYTWTGSATENGWIYAERLNIGGLAGWIPTNVVKLLPLSYQYRRVTKTCPSFSDLHLASEQGDILLVDGASTEQGTDEGWVHAECLDGARVGLFPTSSLEQLPVTLQWMYAVNSLAAQHESQATVESGDMVLVDPETRTKEGWVYAWAADRRHTTGAQAGWVPVNCLEWPLSD